MPGTRNTTFGSMLLASNNPEKLLRFYQDAFSVPRLPNGFLDFGTVTILIDSRDDIERTAVEPQRSIINLHVSDARGLVVKLSEMGARPVSPLEERSAGLFAAFADPDGNYFQIIQLRPDYDPAAGTSTTR